MCRRSFFVHPQDTLLQAGGVGGVFLAVNILFHDFQWCSTAETGKIAGGTTVHFRVYLFEFSQRHTPEMAIFGG